MDVVEETRVSDVDVKEENTIFVMEGILMEHYSACGLTHSWCAGSWALSCKSCDSDTLTKETIVY